MQNYDTLFLNFNREKFKFECKEIDNNENLVPDSSTTLQEFVYELNKVRYPCISRYWYLSFLFLILYIILFFLVMFILGAKYIFIAIIFFFMFFIWIIISGILQSKWNSKITNIIDKYENKLKNFYRMENNDVFHHGYRSRRRSYYYFKIRFYPIVNGRVLNIPMVSPFFNNAMMGQMMYNNQMIYNNQLGFNNQGNNNQIPINTVNLNQNPETINMNKNNNQKKDVPLNNVNKLNRVEALPENDELRKKPAKKKF